MRRWLGLIIVLLLTTSLYGAQEVRHGLSTRFADVILSGLKPGMVYSIKKEKGLPYKVTNKTDKAIDVEVVVEVPTPSELKPGYEPVPDVSWVKAFPTVFHLEPGESTDCDVIISIPEGKEYANRHFQVMLVTQTVEKPGVSGIAISFALASRLRFSTGPTPLQVLEENRKRILEALKMDLAPFSLFLPELPVGGKVQIDGDKIPTLQLVNRSNEDYKVEFYLAEDPKRYGLRGDYEPLPEEVKVSFKEKQIESKRRSINDVLMEIEIPGDQQFYGKNYGFVVIAKIPWFDIPIELYSRVYLKTQEGKRE